MKVACSALGLAFACTPATAPPNPGVAQVPFSSGTSSSDYSGYDRGTPGAKGLRVPHRELRQSPSSLVASAELYRLGFAVREEAPTPARAVAQARERVTAVSAELVRALGKTAKTEPKGLALSEWREGEQVRGYTATVDALLEVGLAPGGDLFSHAEVYAAIVGVTQDIARRSGTTSTALTAVSFDAPEPHVRDPEARREELVKRWVESVRSFTRVAEADTAKLYLTDCRIPGEIMETTESIDRVRLMLSFSCRLETPRTPARLEVSPDAEE